MNRFLALSLVVTILGMGLSAQQQPPAESPATPTIRVTTQLVLVNVLVHDHHGNPITDLTKADFELMDAGTPRKISVFAVDQIAGTAANAQKSPMLPRNIASNRPVGRVGVPSSVTIVLVDTYNTKITDQSYATSQLRKFLKTVRPEDRIAIYTLNSNGFGIVHDFTNNSFELEAAVSKTRPLFSHQLDGSNPEPANTGNDDLDANIDASNTIVSNFFTRNRILNTCESFKALAEHLSGIPGRKNLVWLTGSVPISIGFGDPADIQQAKQKAGGAAAEQEHFAEYIEDATHALNNANVAVYPVDARGLLLPTFTEASTRGKFNPSRPPPASLTMVDNRNAETMDFVADLTGGKAYHNTNDLAGAVRKAIDDSSVSYTLGFYVTGEEWDNKYHSLKVKVNRPSVTVRLKKGYVAEEKKTPTTAQLANLLREAVWSPLDSTKLSVTTRIDPSIVKANASRLTFAIDANEIEFHLAEGKYQGQIDILFVQVKKGGAGTADQKRTASLALAPDRLATILDKGITFSDDLSLTTDTVAVRVIVMDRATGNTGSVTIPVAAQDNSGATVAAPPEPAKPQR